MTNQYDNIKKVEYTEQKKITTNLNLDKKNNSLDDEQISRNFLDRFKTWEQLQRPWSGKW